MRFRSSKLNFALDILTFFVQGQRLTYTHFTSKVNWNSMIEITFNRYDYLHALSLNPSIFAGRWRSTRIKFIGLEWCSTRQVKSFNILVSKCWINLKFTLNIRILRWVGIQWVCAPAGSTRKAPSSRSASVNPMIRWGMDWSGEGKKTETVVFNNLLNWIGSRSLIFSRVENQGWSTCWRKICWTDENPEAEIFQIPRADIL